jgi:hypothetical protein
MVRLGDTQVESELFRRFFASQDVLGFLDRGQGTTYRNQPPRCTAWFYMESPTAPLDSLRLEINFEDNGNGEYLRSSHQWERLGQGETDPARMLDINMIDLMNR